MNFKNKKPIKQTIENNNPIVLPVVNFSNPYFSKKINDQKKEDKKDIVINNIEKKSQIPNDLKEKLQRRKKQISTLVDSLIDIIVD